MDILSQAQVIAQNLSFAVQLIVSIGGVAVAIIAVIQLWQYIKPDYKSEIEKAKKEIEEIIEEIEEKVDKLAEKTMQNEIDIRAIDVPLINTRFDKIENKLDDVLKLFITNIKH